MLSKLHRLRGLAARYRTDRRLPPQVLGLFTETVGLRRRDAAARRVSTRGVSGSAEATARLGTSVIRVDGELPMSTADLGHDVATSVVNALTAGGITAFAVDRHGDGLEFGVQLPDRAAAVDALVDQLEGPAWHLQWFDGSKDGVVPVNEARGHRRVVRARAWRVFRAHSWGERAIGSEQATEISFWEVGASGHAERIGTRGHARFDVRSVPTIERIDGREYPGNSAFPVGSNFEHMADPIDIVYTWVDGADPEWAQAFRETAESAGRLVDEVALDPARYRSRDELRYSLRSVWAYCGWVRKIWIVTAGQAPEWLLDDDRVTVVDHREILPPDALPTFNSHAIESALHHIDGLAEHFIYFNDDMAIARPVRPELFFTPNGLGRVFLSGARVEGAEDEYSLAVDTGARRGRELLAERFGRVVTGKPYHAPYPLRRSTLHSMEVEFADIVGRTAHSRFRSPTDLSIAASFGGNYGIAVADSVIGDIATDYVHVESGRLQWHLDRIRLSGRFDTFCVNETRDGLGGAPDREQRIADFFEAMFPVAAPWERSEQT
ncbi:MAG: stealth family protein [Ilumatobacter sp.]